MAVTEIRTHELPYWVGLHRISRLGAARFALLEAAFDSMEEAWLAGSEELVAAGLDPRTAEEVVRRRPEIDVRAECERLAEAGVRALHRPHPAYPARLREIDDAPPVIYIRGSWEAQDDWSVSVVGTRRATAYGRQAADELARDLAAHGVTVVSGLARGVDTVSHRAALDAGGRTVAVLANGLDTIYPPENRGLAADIAEQGALITDYPLGTKPRAEFFPRRNRIMSGLSLGTLIITYIIAVPIGIYSATHPYSVGDYAGTVFGFIGLATPNFLLALILMFVTLRLFGWSPGGLFSPEFLAAPWSLARVWDLMKHLPVPLIVIGTAGTAGLIRILRSSLSDELSRQYVITARAKGVAERRILFKYPVRIAINPIISAIGYLLPGIVSGEALVSIVLSLPTIGPMLLDGLRQQDMYLASSVILMLGMLTMVGTLISDMLLVVVDPRIRFEQKN